VEVALLHRPRLELLQVVWVKPEAEVAEPVALEAQDLMVIAGAQGREEVEDHPDLVEQLRSGVEQEVVRLER
tara:strand:- start:295 stop:510 length:216 start_codon:yes stop_codon:yes gene_type:complete